MFGFSAKQIFMLLVLIVALFAGSQFIPAYFHAYQFNDAVGQEVRFAVSTRKTPEQVSSEVLAKSKEFGIDVQPGDIHLTRRGPAFTLTLDYVIPVDLRVYKHDLSFHISEDGELLDQ